MAAPKAAPKAAPRMRKPSVDDIKIGVADLIQCAICINTPKDPRSLPCLHTYCLRCLELYHSRSVTNKVFDENHLRCPECSKIADVPAGGLKDLPTDFRIKQLEEILGTSFTIQDEPDTPPISPVDSTPPTDNPLGRHSTDNSLPRLSTVVMAETLHDLIHESPRQAREFLNTLGQREKKRAAAKLIDGRSALCVACEAQAYDLMITLIESCKADVNQIVVGLSREGKQVESSILIQAAAAGDITAAQVLVSRGAQVNQADGEGITPLFVASIEGNMDLIDYLVDVGADINYNTNKYGVSPLIVASSRGHLNVLKCLIDKHGDINCPQKDGKTALMVACEKSPEPDMTVAFLLTQWANANAQDDKGWTAVIYALRRPSLDTVTILLMNGAHVNVKDNDGQTSLHHAVTLSNIDAIQMLIGHGADPNVKDNRNCTPLQLASHNRDMVKILKTYKKIKRKK